jgi:GT2 family glycosyltransferase
MKLGLVIASCARPALLKKTLLHLMSQQRVPDEIVLSVIDAADIPKISPAIVNLQIEFGRPGLTCQRNRGISRLINTTDVIAFIDDDFIVGDDYFFNMEKVFEQERSIVGMNSEIIADGAKSKGFTFDEGLKLAEQYRRREKALPLIREIKGPYAYGCNGILAFRNASLGSIRFDERLALYGWQEDLDFCGALLRSGRMVKTNLVWGVHLGVKHGKGSDLCLGYSQIANPVYIARKGHVSVGYAFRLAARNMLANLVGSVRSESYIDRRGRLRGNLIGLIHLMSRRLTPDYVLKLSEAAPIRPHPVLGEELGNQVPQRPRPAGARPLVLDQDAHDARGRRPEMRLGLVIASHRRPDLLEAVLMHLTSQRRVPDDIVLSSVDAADIPKIGPTLANVRKVFGSAGLTSQRNRGMSCLVGTADIIIFVDDDFVVGDDYFLNIERIFAQDESIIGVQGAVVADGAKSCGFTFEEGLRLAERYRLKEMTPEIRDIRGTYGCNMAFRTASIGSVRFDERLPLYGWQEDLDFCGALRRFGRIVATNLVWGVHLGSKRSKGSEVRLGYSQIVNPAYIVSKGNMSFSYALQLATRNFLANLVKSAWPESYVDRRGRLRGNVIGIFHLVTGRLTPEYILKLK